VGLEEEEERAGDVGEWVLRGLVVVVEGAFIIGLAVATALVEIDGVRVEVAVKLIEFVSERDGEILGVKEIVGEDEEVAD